MWENYSAAVMVVHLVDEMVVQWVVPRAALKVDPLVPSQVVVLVVP